MRLLAEVARKNETKVRKAKLLIFFVFLFVFICADVLANVEFVVNSLRCLLNINNRIDSSFQPDRGHGGWLEGIGLWSCGRFAELVRSRQVLSAGQSRSNDS